MEIKEDNFNYSNLKERIKDYSHQDKVRCGIYCSELVIDIYESNYDSKAPRSAIEAAKAWVESPTEHNRKAALDAAVRASAAREASPIVSDNAAASATHAAHAAAFAAAFADNYAAYAAVIAACAGGDNIKSKIISWFNNSDHKC